MLEGKRSIERMTAEGEEKKKMLRAEEWVLEHAGDRFGFSPEKATESLAILVRYQNSIVNLMNKVEREENSEEKKEKIDRGS